MLAACKTPFVVWCVAWLALQLLFDFGAAYSIFISSTFFALGPPFFGRVVLVYLLDFLAIYFAIGIFFDVVTLTSILFTTFKLGTAPMAFYDGKHIEQCTMRSSA